MRGRTIRGDSNLNLGTQRAVTIDEYKDTLFLYYYLTRSEVMYLYFPHLHLRPWVICLGTPITFPARSSTILYLLTTYHTKLSLATSKNNVIKSSCRQQHNRSTAPQSCLRGFISSLACLWCSLYQFHSQPLPHLLHLSPVVCSLFAYLSSISTSASL